MYISLIRIVIVYIWFFGIIINISLLFLSVLIYIIILDLKYVFFDLNSIIFRKIIVMEGNF